MGSVRGSCSFMLENEERNIHGRAALNIEIPMLKGLASGRNKTIVHDL